jgi:hypothetical protein
LEELLHMVKVVHMVKVEHIGGIGSNSAGGVRTRVVMCREIDGELLKLFGYLSTNEVCLRLWDI